jgi:fatty acid desaturase
MEFFKDLARMSKESDARYAEEKARLRAIEEKYATPEDKKRVRRQNRFAIVGGVLWLGFPIFMVVTGAMGVPWSGPFILLVVALLILIPVLLWLGGGIGHVPDKYFDPRR